MPGRPSGSSENQSFQHRQSITDSVIPTTTSGAAMTNHMRMAIYRITQGTYPELMERAREGMAPILRESPGFVFYSTTDVGGDRFVSVSTWQTREQAQAAAEKAAGWVSGNLADSVSLEENLIGEMTT